MEKRVSAAEANRHFTHLLKGVQSGATFVITSHRKAVAKLIPIAEDDARKDRAWRHLLARLESQPAIRVGRWTRDELYEDSP